MAADDAARIDGLGADGARRGGDASPAGYGEPFAPLRLIGFEMPTLNGAAW
jgi:hypothetical protein